MLYCLLVNPFCSPVSIFQLLQYIYVSLLKKDAQDLTIRLCKAQIPFCMSFIPLSCSAYQIASKYKKYCPNTEHASMLFIIDFVPSTGEDDVFNCVCQSVHRGVAVPWCTGTGRKEEGQVGRRAPKKDQLGRTGQEVWTTPIPSTLAHPSQGQVGTKLPGQGHIGDPLDRRNGNEGTWSVLPGSVNGRLSCYFKETVKAAFLRIVLKSLFLTNVKICLNQKSGTFKSRTFGLV